MHRPDIDTFVKLCANDLVATPHRTADESKLPPLPRFGFLPFKVAVHIHEKILRFPFQEGAIVRGKVDERPRPQNFEDKKQKEGSPDDHYGGALLDARVALACRLAASLSAASAFFLCSGNSFSRPMIG